jgi:hypothetical protein
MNKFTQTVYEFGQPICDEMIITKDTCIENKKSKVIPVIFEDKIIGQGVIDTSDDGIICDGVLYSDLYGCDDISVDDELKIGMFFIKEEHYEDDLMILYSIQIDSIQIMK